MADDPYARIARLEAEVASLRSEVGRLRPALAEALEQQTATADILRVIASSPTDVDVVLDTIARTAAHLCATDDVTILHVDGRLRRAAAHVGPYPSLASQHWDPIDPGTIVGRVVVDRRTHHVPDWQAAADTYPRRAELAAQGGNRASLAVPMLRDGAVVGVLHLRQAEVRPFTAQQIALLETFADQAVTAIENARLFEALQEANRQPEEASRHKSQFLANMSHELRPPLYAIIGYSEMLQEEAEETDADAFLPDLVRINAAGKHLLGLINDILDLSKIEAGRMDLFVETFSISQLVRDVQAIVQPLVKQNGNTLVVTCPDDLGTMHADQAKVRQALFNLLSNAAKFTDDGTISLTVIQDGIGSVPSPQDAMVVV